MESSPGQQDPSERPLHLHHSQDNLEGHLICDSSPNTSHLVHMFYSSVSSARLRLAIGLAICLLALVSCSTPEGTSDRDQKPEVQPEITDLAEPNKSPKQWALAVHGGAGTISDDGTDRQPYFDSLEAALREGGRRLQGGEAALDVIEAVVTLLEDDPLFNAGRGAVFNNRGVHELDAAIMDGRSLACGAVAGMRNIRNPIQLARSVMQESPHVFLAGDGADDFARSVSARRATQSYFNTEARYRQWQEVRSEEREARRVGRTAQQSGFGTVGAVVLDRYGNLAAGTSTGGLTNKRHGRIGDVPVIGAGTYANNETAAISCTGKGEEFIRHTIAYDVTARMKYGGESLNQAAESVIKTTLQADQGGLIAIDANGEIVMPFNTEGMYRGSIDSDGLLVTGIWEELKTQTNVSLRQ